MKEVNCFNKSDFLLGTIALTIKSIKKNYSKGAARRFQEEVQEKLKINV